LLNSMQALRTHFVGPFPLASHDVIIRHYLSPAILPYFIRCFGPISAYPESLDSQVQSLLRQCLLKGSATHPPFGSSTEQTCVRFRECGILVDARTKPGASSALHFTSPIAARYVHNLIFPNRSSRMPTSVQALVIAVVRGMSATTLRQSVVSQEDFPPEATFQQLMMEGLHRNTPASCGILSELSKLFPSGHPNEKVQRKVSERMDFYLNSSVRWALEPMVNGSKVGDHIKRFTGAGGYYGLQLNDYAVIDFRGSKSGRVTRAQRHPIRITVYFKTGDYSTCTVVCGCDEPQTIQLAP